MDKETHPPKRPVVWNPLSIQSHSQQAPYYKFRVPYSAKLFADLCGHLQIGSSSEVMDAGCGTGHVTEHLVNYAKRVHAVDGSAEMIQHASKFANASYYTSDLNQEKFAVPGGVDHIFFGRCIHHFPSSSVDTLVANNLRANGSLVTCSSEWLAEGGWGDAYASLRKRFEEGEGEGEKPDITGQSNLPEIGFAPSRKFVDSFRVLVDARYLSRLTLARAYRGTLKNLLDDFENFEKEMSRLLEPYSKDGKLKMIVRSWAFAWYRKAPGD